MAVATKYEVSSALGEPPDRRVVKTVLLNNGLIVQEEIAGFWLIRRYCRTETFDFPWDVWLRDSQQWGAAAYTCFTAIRKEAGFKTAAAAIRVAEKLEPSPRIESLPMSKETRDEVAKMFQQQ